MTQHRAALMLCWVAAAAVLMMFIPVRTSEALKSPAGCKPAFGMGKKECTRMIRKCANKFGIDMKWTSVGSVINGVRQGDGGCQCNGYCGFKTGERCNADSQCIWKNDACYNRKTNEVGTVMTQCFSGTVAPTTSTPSTAPTCTSGASGVLQNTPRTTLLTPDWTICYEANFDESTSIATIDSACTGTEVMMGCYDSAAPDTIVLAARAPKSVAFTDYGDGNDQFAEFDGVRFYKSPSWSWGFAPACAILNRNSCDYNPGDQAFPEQRMCWHTGSGSVTPGYRCGSSNVNAAWNRFVAYRNAAP